MATGNSRQNTLNLVEEIRGEINRPNAHPVFQRAIDSSKGIRITGTFKTTYADTPSPMSYITVRRRDNAAVVSDGLGIAWSTGSEYDGNYNLYFVDNNILTDDLPIRKDGFIQEDSINNFLAYGIATIEPNVEYKFGLEIDSTWGMKFCVYSGTLAGGPNFASAFDASTNVSGYRMSIGARLDGHEPQASGSHFGIGVLDSKGADWIYDDIHITSLVEGYVASLFKMYASPADFSENEGFRIYGKGACEGSPGKYGLDWYTWNASSGLWEHMAHNPTASTVAFTYDYSSLGKYLDESNFVNVMAIASDSSSEGTLNMDYIRLSTIQSSGIHTGHMTDIYLHAPGRIAQATNEITGVTGGVAELDSLNHPIHEIEAVYYTAGGPVIGALERDTVSGLARYVVSNTRPHYTYSTEEDLALQVPLDANITVVYTYYMDGDVVQNFINNDNYRLPTTDNLAKIAPPASITFNTLQYRGSVEEAQMRTLIKNWVNNLIREDFEVTDLIAHLYSNGVTYVNLSNLDIAVKEYKMDGSIRYNGSITNTYSVTSPATFYTDENKMIGVTKL